MTAEEVQDLIGVQSSGNRATANDHRITLGETLVTPRMVSVIARHVKNGWLEDTTLDVWLVGQENRPDGYKIILREDGSQFGLASIGFPNDRFPVLVGWYGSLLSAFLGM
jgi:hypothetical protein